MQNLNNGQRLLAYGQQIFISNRVGTYRVSVTNAYWLTKRFPLRLHMSLGNLPYQLVFVQKCKVNVKLIKLRKIYNSVIYEFPRNIYAKCYLYS